VIRKTRIWELIRCGKSPLSYEDFSGEIEHLPSKASGTLGAEDVMVFYPPGGGGYGDPLDREPARVAQDVAEGRVSPERAREIYGVVLTADRAVDDEATRLLRDGERQNRCRGEASDWNLADTYRHPNPESGTIWPIGENLGIAPDGFGTIVCRRCERALTGPKGSVVRRLSPLSAAGPWLALRWQGDSPNFKLEAVSCPSCGVQLAVREIFLK
jgi:N-methylhydantoinase B